MAKPAPVGSDVAAGTYWCTNCGYELDVLKRLPVCPFCGGLNEWTAVSDGDSVNDAEQKLEPLNWRSSAFPPCAPAYAWR